MGASSLSPAPGNALAALRSSLPESLSRALVSAAELRRNTPRREVLPTSVPPFDALLRGGLPRGALVEVVAPRSSGRFSLGLAALAAATQSGEAAALVDLGDHLDPQAAAALGVDLQRLLWVRPQRAKDALAAAETLLAAGFPLVVLDLGLRVPRGARRPGAWLRLSRGALLHDAALLVLSPARLTGAAAGAVLSARGQRPLWSAPPVPLSRSASLPPASGAGGVPRVLEGLSTRLTLEKRAGEPPGLSGAWRLRTTESLAAGTVRRGSDPAVRPAAEEPHARPSARRVARG